MRKKRVGIWIFLTMSVLLAVFSFTAEAKEPKGTIVMSIEKFTLGQGYLMEPQYVPFYEGDTMASVTLRELTRIGCSYNYDGRMTQGFYISEISDPDRGETKIPQYILDALEQGRMKLYKDFTPEYLGEFDYTRQSGWMYSINGAFPDVSACEMIPKNGQTLRWQFTLVGIGRDLAGDKMYFEENNLKGLNREEMVRLLAMMREKPELLADAAVSQAWERCMRIGTGLRTSKQDLEQDFITLRHALKLNMLSDLSFLEGVSRECQVKSGIPQEEISFPTHLKARKDGKKEIHVNVTWSCDGGYTPDQAGVYIFRPELPEAYLLDEGESLPTFRVTVQKLGDVNSDGQVNLTDLEELLPFLGREVEQDEDEAVYDLNIDGRIDMQDYSMLVGAMNGSEGKTEADSGLELVFDKETYQAGETAEASLMLYNAELDTIGLQLAWNPETCGEVQISPEEGLTLEKSEKGQDREFVMLGSREKSLRAYSLHGLGIAKIRMTCLVDGRPELAFGEDAVELLNGQTAAAFCNGSRISVRTSVYEGAFRILCQLNQGNVQYARLSGETVLENGVEVTLADVVFAASDAEDVPENRIRILAQMDGTYTLTVGTGLEKGEVTGAFTQMEDGSFQAEGADGCFTGGCAPWRESCVLYALLEKAGEKSYYKLLIERKGYEAVRWNYTENAPFLISRWSKDTPEVLTAPWNTEEAGIKGWDENGDERQGFTLALPDEDSEGFSYQKNPAGEGGILRAAYAGDFWMEIRDSDGKVCGKVRAAALYPYDAAEYFLKQARSISLEKEDYDPSVAGLLFDYKYCAERVEEIQKQFPENIPVYLDGLGRYTSSDTGVRLTDAYGYTLCADSLRTEAVNELRLAISEVQPKLLAHRKKETSEPAVLPPNKQTGTQGDQKPIQIKKPGKVKITAVTSPGAKRMKIKWKRVSGASGYQIQYAQGKTFRKNSQILRVKSGKRTTATVKAKKRKKTYYVRIRAWKKISGKTVYGAWSTKKKIKIK